MPLRSSIVITRGRLEEEDDVPDSALGFADEEAPGSALGQARTDADADTTWPVPSATHVQTFRESPTTKR